MTLHDEIEKVLKKTKRPMTAREVAGNAIQSVPALELPGNEE
jgi:ATP-dependent protease Clp ATPase subunit